MSGGSICGPLGDADAASLVPATLLLQMQRPPSCERPGPRLAAGCLIPRGFQQPYTTSKGKGLPPDSGKPSQLAGLADRQKDGPEVCYCCRRVACMQEASSAMPSFNSSTVPPMPPPASSSSHAAQGHIRKCDSFIFLFWCIDRLQDAASCTCTAHVLRRLWLWHVRCVMPKL